MKTAPVVAALARRPDQFEQVLVHTGQHYDYEMSRIFIEELDLGEPDYVLQVGSGSHAQQSARVLERLEPVLLHAAPDVVLVPGDVNSTMASAIVASKVGIPVGHIEAGLRSFDRAMPEELNRVVTDAIADLLFIHSPEARGNDPLRRQHHDRHACCDARPNRVAERAGAARPEPRRLPRRDAASARAGRWSAA
jgi:UDP-N-acetylglucosamine 2-epimerase (non-hydrolysing)